ncbi:MAG TPA: S8 family serine peptidase, partial [Mycobacteriales bacterium]|nr:S8 family serine peptidase [Mycobacteriales bacterium]
MCEVAAIPGMAGLWDQTLGDERICVAVLDGPVDLSHRAVSGASVTRLKVWPDEGYTGPRAKHGTHVASVLFGQPGGPVRGVAPGCRGLCLPVFSERRSRTSQLDLARGIEHAVEAGAHVINISGGQFSPSGEAEDLLARAVRLCAERNVLVVAAAGNDGCFCDHVPAALPSSLAVGALDDEGRPLAMSNWGRTYQEHGILAPGENVRGAVPGGGTARATGTSLATPITAGVAALLLSMQVRSGRAPDPLGVRAALLAGADPCELSDPDACRRFLTGKLNIRRAMSAVQNESAQPVDAVVQSCDDCGGVGRFADGAKGVYGADLAVDLAADPPGDDLPPGERARATALAGTVVPAAAEPVGVVPAEVPAAPVGPRWDPYVYALGVVGNDFGSEARRDSFKQLMAPVAVDSTVVPANPYDARQMV